MAGEHTRTNPLRAAFLGMMRLPVTRQLGLLLGLVASLALGVYVVMWPRSPDDSVLYRQALAAQGQKQGLYTQHARMQQELESGLSRTIMAIATVQQARVHLALPMASALDGDRPSASVLITLAPKRHLDAQQIAAIVHLIASSVPNLESDAITLVDNRGRLLSQPDTTSDMGLATQQLEYRHRLERQLASNIENILSPLVGTKRVRAQVVVSLDRSQSPRRHKTHAIKKLAVAVLVDHKTIKNARGELNSTIYSQDELDRFTALAKEAVGFDDKRGDIVNVINAKFASSLQTSSFDPAWGWDTTRQVLGGLLAALILFGVLRPVMINLASIPSQRQRDTDAAANSQGDEQNSLPDRQGQQKSIPIDYKTDLSRTRAMAVKEPRWVAQVIKQWVNEG